MNNKNLVLILLVLFLFGCTTTQTKNSITTEQTQTSKATTPTPRTLNFSWMTVKQWQQKHQSHIDIATTKNPDILFIGDSITESWTWGDGRSDVYHAYFDQYNAANFAIGGDMTQNLLWRLQHGIKGNIQPKVAILMIGTNNFLHQQQQPSEVLAGVKAVIEQIQANYQDVKILTLAILPIYQNHDNASRQYIPKTNQLLAQLADNKRVFFLNFSDQFLDENGDIPSALMADYIHPTAKGLEIVAKNIAPALQHLLNKK